MRLLTGYTKLFGWKVRGGPFRGMQYVDQSICSTLAPKLLGSYEAELEHRIERIIANPPATIINIGAAEGYYAVGLALRCPRSRIVAFEMEAEGRALIAQLAAKNGVAARIDIRGACSPETLAPLLDETPAPLLIVDIEGYEVTLLDPAILPALRRCPMLVELHDDREPASRILAARFEPTHEQTLYSTRSRTIADLPTPVRQIARVAGSRRFVNALSENRPGPMQWLHAEPRG